MMRMLLIFTTAASASFTAALLAPTMNAYIKLAVSMAMYHLDYLLDTLKEAFGVAVMILGLRYNMEVAAYSLIFAVLALITFPFTVFYIIHRAAQMVGRLVDALI